MTSGSFSPSLGYGIGMGYITPEYKDAGTQIKLTDSKVQLEAEIIKRPFYKDGSLKK